MAKLKKITAILVLRGVSILGILIGLSLVYFTVVVLLPTLLEDNFVPEDNLALRCGEFILAGVVLVMSAYLVYTSCLMFRGRAFRAIELIAGGLAIYVFVSVVDPLTHFAAKWVSGVQARTVVGLASFFASLLLSVLVYLICTRPLKRLVKVAYSPGRN
ncbi:MAG TPA: hypothetical protein VMW24_05125 [Sedimentisphaerales bacterium]|nr:hypothetical protein [Sedimentisphaerales bacterium]